MRLLLYIILTVAAFCASAQNYVAEISFVSVESTTGWVSIVWQPDTIVANQTCNIYRWSNKWVEIESSWRDENNTYIDRKAHPADKPERYCRAYTNGELGHEHRTIFLQAGNFDLCSGKLRLEWSPYVGAEVAEYDIFGRKDVDSFFSQLGTISDTAFITDILQSGIGYVFYVRATLKIGDNAVSYSNKIIYNPPVPVAPTVVRIDSVVSQQEVIKLTGTIDMMATVQGYAWQHLDGDTWVTDTLLTDLQSAVVRHNAPSVNAAYRLAAIDMCGLPSLTSDIVKPLIVEVETSSSKMLIEWNQSIGNSEQATVFYSVDGSNFSTWPATIGGNSVSIGFDAIADDEAQNFCVKVEAATDSCVSLSDVVCIERQPDVNIPNAFTPNGDGLNDTFGPIIRQAQVASFEFIIYDRYGGRVFSTTDASKRWDGTIGGSYAAEGGYLYYLKMKLQNGSTIERKGSVNLIYP